MRMIGRLLMRLTDAATFIAGIALALMMIQVTLDVAMRHFFAASIPGTLTVVSHYYMVLTVFIPLALAERMDSHISVEVFTGRLPKIIRKYLSVLTTTLSVAVFGLLTARTLVEAVSKQKTGALVIQENIAIPIWPSFYFLPIGCGLMTAMLVYKLIARPQADRASTAANPAPGDR